MSRSTHHPQWPTAKVQPHLPPTSATSQSRFSSPMFKHVQTISDGLCLGGWWRITGSGGCHALRRKSWIGNFTHQNCKLKILKFQEFVIYQLYKYILNLFRPWILRCIWNAGLRGDLVWKRTWQGKVWQNTDEFLIMAWLDAFRWFPWLSWLPIRLASTEKNKWRQLQSQLLMDLNWLIAKWPGNIKILLARFSSM